MDKKKILKKFQNHYNISKSGCSNQWKHIKDCRSFYNGDYMNYKDEVTFGRGAGMKVKEVSFNRVKPYVNSIVGFMAQQRRKPDYQAKLESSPDQTALSDYLNGFSDYVRENTNSDQMETRQDMDFIIGGIGCTDTAATLKIGAPTRDPNGEIIVERVDPCEVGYDPAAIMPNLLDSGWVYRVKEYDVEEAEELFNAEEEDFETTNTDDDLVYEFNPYGGIQDKIGYEWADPQRTRVRVYFYQWFEVETFYRIENPLKTIDNQDFFELLAVALSQVEIDEEEEMFRFDPASPILTITKSNKSEISKIFETFDIPFNPVQEKRKCFYTAVISGNKVFDYYKSVSQQGFSIKFKTGDRDERNNIWTGIVSSMREPQRYYNKALTELMLIIASNARGGVMYEEGAVDNVAEFEASWAMFNRATKVNDGAVSGGRIQSKAQPAMATGYEGILEASGAALSQVTGIDESFFGAIAGGNETAMLQRQRIKQATTTLAVYFDSIALYAKEQARMMLSFMRLLAKASDGKLFKMHDDDGNAIFEKISLDFFVEEYEISIGESPETPIQKEYYTQTLIAMAQSMQAIGDPRYLQMYAAAVKYMPIPSRDKNAIVEVLMGQQQIDPGMVEQLQKQIQQLQGEQAQIASAKMIADINKTNTETQAKVIDIQKTTKEINKLDEDIEGKALENDIMAMKPITEINTTI